jgi:hypothetical protein
MMLLLVCLLLAVARIGAVTSSCTLDGFFEDSALTQPWQATLELLSTSVNGVAVPSSLSVSLPNPSHGFFYTEVAPGTSVQPFCSFPDLATNLFPTFGIVNVAPPANPVPILLWHWYMWEPAQISRILPNDPGWNGCTTWTPSADVTGHGIFLNPPVCVPQMGAHWLPNKMNLFDANTLIPVWGSYNQTIIFKEYSSQDGLWPYLETLQAHADSGSYALPRWPQTSGWYPASVRIELLGAPAFDTVRMTVYDFEYLESREDHDAALQARYDAGVVAGEDSCDTCDDNTYDCDGAFGTVIQFGTLALLCLFYFLF